MEVLLHCFQWSSIHFLPFCKKSKQLEPQKGKIATIIILFLGLQLFGATGVMRRSRINSF